LLAVREGNHGSFSADPGAPGILPRMFSAAACHGRGVSVDPVRYEQLIVRLMKNLNDLPGRDYVRL